MKLLCVLASLGAVMAQPGCTPAPAPTPTTGTGAPTQAQQGGGQKASYITVMLVKNDLANLGTAVGKAFTDAGERWSQVIQSQLPSIKLTQAVDLQQQCGPGATLSQGALVQNMIIFASVTTIDGVGKILGQAAPCAFSTVNGNSMPRVGTMTFDAADVQALLQKGTFAATVQHEMGHIIGVGSAKWQQRVANKGTATPAYTGQLGVNGVKGFNAIGGKGVQVPVEANGGPGTALAHWSENVFQNELMTGFLSGVTQPMSAMTIGSLVDLGYQVDPTAGDKFAIPAAGRRLDGHDHEDEPEHARMLAEGGWENPTWPDISKEATMLGENGLYVASTSSVEAELVAQDVVQSQSSTPVIVGAAAGGALAMLAVVAVVANMRNKKADAVAPSTMSNKYFEGQL
jgi:hypothetical protein